MIKNLRKIIDSGESQTVEFKSTFGKEAIESIVAFVNTKGGKLIIGVDNNKKIIGVQTSSETLQKWINQIKQNTNPAVIPEVYETTMS
ncbi:unnamed protein product, partial [marine sediment metagenome]